MEWTLVNTEAPWEGRHTAGACVHDGRMWILGGDCIQGHYQTDCWSSADGIAWECATRHAPWGGRILHMSATFDGAMWVMGGQSSPSFGATNSGGLEHTYHSDVWRSEDGAKWTQVADDCPWGPRGMVSGSAILHGRLFILGGGTYETPEDPGRFFNNDVWSTADGISWVRDAAETPWDPRQYHDVAAWDEKMWVLAGANFGGERIRTDFRDSR